MTRTVIAGVASVVLSSCATAPSDPYQASLWENDQRSVYCGAFGNVQCQQRVAAERQQIVSEEMAKRQREETRAQTEAMREALQATQVAQPAPSVTVAPAQWCMMIVDGARAVEGCYPDRVACNKVWGDVRAAGTATTDCAEKVPTAVAAPQAVVPPRPMPTQWCINVGVEGGTVTESCYDDRGTCDGARGFHTQAGAASSECVNK